MHLTGGPLKAQQEQNRQYLLRLDPDRLLSRFRSEAGLKPKAPPYGGWESSKVKSVDLAGHILTFWMAGAATTEQRSCPSRPLSDDDRQPFADDDHPSTVRREPDGVALHV